MNRSDATEFRIKVALYRRDAQTMYTLAVVMVPPLVQSCVSND